MDYDFNQVVNRTNTNSVKWEFMHLFEPKATPDTIPLWVADMDFPCAEPIIKALHKRIDRKIFGYSTQNTGEYWRAVCGWYQHRFNWYVNSSDIVFSPGVVPAIGYLLEILTEPGDGILIQRPVYYPFTSKINAHNRIIINNPLRYQNGMYTMDFDDLAQKAADPKTKVMIFCSPHNPVGRVWHQDELKRLGQICLENDLIIVSDEIHFDLVRRGVTHTPLVTLFPEQKNRIITATAPSKTFNLAGLQLSNIIIHDKAIRARWDKFVRERLSINGPNALSIVAAQAAYTEGEEWLEEVLDYLDGNIRFMRTFLQKYLPQVVFPPLEGTYLAWLDFRAYGFSQKDLVKKIVHDAKVLIEDGTMFGEEGSGFMRVNVACPRSILEEALRRTANVLTD